MEILGATDHVPKGQPLASPPEASAFHPEEIRPLCGCDRSPVLTRAGENWHLAPPGRIPRPPEPGEGGGGVRGTGRRGEDGEKRRGEELAGSGDWAPWERVGLSPTEDGEGGRVEATLFGMRASFCGLPRKTEKTVDAAWGDRGERMRGRIPWRGWRRRNWPESPVENRWRRLKGATEDLSLLDPFTQNELYLTGREIGAGLSSAGGREELFCSLQ